MKMGFDLNLSFDVEWRWTSLVFGIAYAKEERMLYIGLGMFHIGVTF
jgi:hypothetical protein